MRDHHAEEPGQGLLSPARGRMLGFMAARLILTIILVAIMGMFIEKLIEWTDNRRIGVSKEVEE